MVSKNIKKPNKLRPLVGRVEKILNNKNKIENWTLDGERYRFRSIFFDELKGLPINFLKKINKKTPKVMFLGAGKGEVILKFKRSLSKIKINPKIDVFGLTKSIYPSIKKIVNKDYSNQIPFEHLNSKLYPKLERAFKGKYDLIIASSSVGYHTIYPANALFTSALMLNKGGKAYIQILTLKSFRKEYIESLYKYFLKDKQKKEIAYYQNQIKNIETIFNRMVNSYNPELNFKLKFIKTKDPKFGKYTEYIEIERIN